MSRITQPVIALLTDFGARDWYVAAMKGVLCARAPRARLVDITHEIPPQDVMTGAFVMAAAAPWFPAGTVFLAVVDPDVGSSRALLAAWADGRFFVGPDNGLLSLCFRSARRARVVRLTNRRLRLPRVSGTFHGRDVMAPVAAYLARGGSLARLGPPAARPVTLALPAVRSRAGEVTGTVLHVDAFGNLITNLRAAHVRDAALRFRRNRRCRLRLRNTLRRNEKIIKNNCYGNCCNRRKNDLCAANQRNAGLRSSWSHWTPPQEPLQPLPPLLFVRR